MAEKKTDILIIGAGPTGLTLACLFAHYQIPFRIVERYPPPCEHSKALVLQPRTLESFDKIDLTHRFFEKGNPLKGITFHKEKNSSVFVDFASKVHSPFSTPLALSQHETERILLQYLQEKNIHIETHTQVVQIQKNEGYKVTLENGTIIHAGWLFGCDGPHSILREKLGISFVGNDEPHDFWLADFIFQKDPLDRSSGHLFTQTFGSVVLIPFPPNAYRLIISRLEEENEISETNITSLIEKYTHIQVPIEKVLWISKFQIHYRLAEKIQSERAFLLGDAFHMHSPVGGQGMNTGMQDAFNLAWKFFQVYKGVSHESILKSYEEERYENAQKLLLNTERATKAADSKSFIAQSFRRHLLPFLLKYTSLSEKIVNINSQLQIQYTQSSIIVNDSIKTHSPKAGQRFPHRYVYCYHSNQRKSLLDITKDFKHHLFLFLSKIEKESFQEAEKIYGLIREKNLPIELHIVCIDELSIIPWMKQYHLWTDRNNEIHTDWKIGHPSLYLVRPDGYIGYYTSKINHQKCLHYVSTVFVFP